MSADEEMPVLELTDEMRWTALSEAQVKFYEGLRNMTKEEHAAHFALQLDAMRKGIVLSPLFDYRRDAWAGNAFATNIFGLPPF